MSIFTGTFSANEWTPHEFIDSQSTDAVLEADVSSLPESNATSTEILVERREPSSSQQKCQHPMKLSLLQLADWDPQKTYDKDPPCCIRYDIVWKVAIKGKRGVHKDMEENQVLAPSSYWELFLKPRVKELALRAGPATRDAENTKVVVSVGPRAVPPFTKQFNNTDIDWSIIEKKLVAWGDFFRAGKKLSVDLSFNYVLDGPGSFSRSSKNTDKRGRLSATQRMRSERAAQLDADEDDSSRPPAWAHVYRVMRCPGPPCEMGRYCWIKTVGKKHHTLNGPHLRRLITHVEEGHPLETHEDVPDDLKRQLEEEERHKLDRKKTNTAASPPTMPPIHITNVLPPQSQQTASSHLESTNTVQPLDSTKANPLSIPGLRDVAIAKYCAWQQAQVENQEDKEHYQKALDIAREDGLDLEQIHEDRNPEFFTKKGVKWGISRRFTSARDIENWTKRHHQDCSRTGTPEGGD